MGAAALARASRERSRAPCCCCMVAARARLRPGAATEASTDVKVLVAALRREERVSMLKRTNWGNERRADCYAKRKA